MKIVKITVFCLPSSGICICPCGWNDWVAWVSLWILAHVLTSNGFRAGFDLGMHQPTYISIRELIFDPRLVDCLFVFGVFDPIWYKVITVVVIKVWILALSLIFPISIAVICFTVAVFIDTILFVGKAIIFNRIAGLKILNSVYLYINWPNWSGLSFCHQIIKTKYFIRKLKLFLQFFL